MSNQVDIFYWDACIFYEYLKDEPVQGTKKIAIRELLLDNEKHRNRICTSAITHLEVLPSKLADDQENKYWSMFGSQYFFDIPIDRNILQLARELKSYYYRPPAEAKAARMLSTGDAVQLSTAIIHEVAEFHTRDGNKRGGNIALLGLDAESPGGLLCGKYALKIVSPNADQDELL